MIFFDGCVYEYMNAPICHHRLNAIILKIREFLICARQAFLKSEQTKDAPVLFHYSFIVSFLLFSMSCSL